MVDNLHVRRSLFGPHEADPPLVVDPHRVLAGPATLQRLEVVPGRKPQVLEHRGRVHGLLHPDYSSWFGYEMAAPNAKIGNTIAIPFTHQNRKWALLPLRTSKKPGDLKIAGASFSTVGKELLSIVDIDEDSAFLRRLQTYFRSRHWEMVPVESLKK